MHASQAGGACARTFKICRKLKSKRNEILFPNVNKSHSSWELMISCNFSLLMRSQNGVNFCESQQSLAVVLVWFEDVLFCIERESSTIKMIYKSTSNQYQWYCNKFVISACASLSSVCEFLQILLQPNSLSLWLADQISIHNIMSYISHSRCHCVASSLAQELLHFRGRRTAAWSARKVVKMGAKTRR